MINYSKSVPANKRRYYWNAMLRKMRFSKTYATLLIVTKLLFMPIHGHTETAEIYTIQTGSFTDLSSAVKQFDAVALGLAGLNGMTLDYLRIEKIGGFYAVRLGRFIDYMSGQEFLQATRSQLTGAIIIKGYIKEERVVKSYEDLPIEDSESATELTPLPKRDDPEPASLPQTSVIDKPGRTVTAADETSPDTRGKVIPELELSREQEPSDERGIFSDIRGKFYVSDYYSTDSGAYNFHVLTSRLNLYKREPESPGYYFEFDGKARKKIINGDLRGNVPHYKVDEAWLGYKFPGRKINVVAGRQYIQELYNTDIDGLNVKYSFENGLGLGVFGGLAPDKFDDSLNTDLRSVGLYGFMNRKDHQVNLGYEYLTYNGEPDREYFSLRTNSVFNKKTRFNALSSVSRNQISDNFEIENANANLSYSYSRNLRFNIFANYYRSIKYYESAKFYFEFSDTNTNFLLDNNSQTRAGIRVDYKIAKGFKVYGSTTYQHRKLDDEDSTRFTAGLRKYDLYGFDLSGRYTYIDNYASRDNEYNVEINRNIMKKFDVSVYASYEETKLDLENAFTNGSRTYGSSLYWPITKKYYLSMFLEFLDEEDYSSTSLFTQLGYKFIP